jgi:hypothetical protein
MITDTNELVSLARELGSHYFDQNTMKFFSSKVHQTVYRGALFVTSEQDDSGVVWGGARRYTVRRFQIVGGALTIDTVGEFGEYATGDEAGEAARRLSVGFKVCGECGRVFDTIGNTDDAGEWAYGHDCEV